VTKLILIPAAQTDWQVQGRLLGDTDLPLNEIGHRQAIADAQAVAALKPAVIRCGPEQATKQTASIIAHELGLRLKSLPELRELDLGLWEGLTVDDLRDRLAKVYRQWREDPRSVEPPEGEALPDAAIRLTKGVQRIIKHHEEDEAVVLVLGPFAAAVVRCELDDHSYDRFWEYVDGERRIHVIEMPAEGVPHPPPDNAA
jgi:probable phosphoglycerate mutase